ncbi:MAG: hypothetical protein ACYC0M_12065 [Burkholderiales bacterium]
MKDIISINRQFLIIAREQANSKPNDTYKDIATGLSKTILDRIGQLNTEEIEELAKSEISLFTLRISEKQIDKILSNLREKKRAAYLLAGLQMI